MSFDIKTSFKANLYLRHLFPGALSRPSLPASPKGLALTGRGEKIDWKNCKL
jgi:hypothetical protein